SLGWAALVLAAGCEQPRTELVVRVDSEVAWGEGQSVQSVVLTVRRGGATGPLRSARTTALGAGDGRRALPLYVGVIAGDDDVETPVWIEALGCGDPNGCDVATARVVQRAVVRFTRGRTEEVPLLLASACVGVTCALDERCTTGGQCEAATRAQETVGPFSGTDAATVAHDDSPTADTTMDAGVVDSAMDAGRDVDSTVDAGGDLGTSMDVTDTPLSDVVVSLDLMSPVDAGAPVDVVVPLDLMTPADVGPPIDVMLPVDRLAVTDALPPSDDGRPACPSGQTLCGASCRDLTSDANHCGRCGAACAAGGAPVCVEGTCARPTCGGRFADCDGNAANGCETDLTATPNHCGACGAVGSEVCDGRDNDCDGVADDGCPTAVGGLTSIDFSSPEYGVGSGTQQSATCPAGQVVRGVFGKVSGNSVSELDVICGQPSLAEDRSVTPHRYAVNLSGSTDVGIIGTAPTPGTAFRFVCPESSVVTRIVGSASSYLYGFSVQCSTLTVTGSPGGLRVTATPGVTSPAWGTAMGTTYDYQCPANAAGSASALQGLFGRSRRIISTLSYVTTVGARCGVPSITVR
ncbi:MAG: hypothetical protein Q8S73_40805, partial [Deltaproteobacteria bacterium]|nr:hypothetical protein [Deltaproteobacteria bacterium]